MLCLDAAMGKARLRRSGGSLSRAATAAGLLAVVIACGLVPSRATAVDTIAFFDTGTPGPTGQQVSGSIIDSNQFLGLPFHIDNPMQVAAVRAHIVEQPLFPGPLFAAIATLSGPELLPAQGSGSTPFGDGVVLASITFTAPTTSAVVEVPLSVSLEPGDYAVIIGSGLFGANGRGYMPANASMSVPSLLIWQGGAQIWENLNTSILQHYVAVVGVEQVNARALHVPDPAAPLFKMSTNESRETLFRAFSDVSLTRLLVNIDPFSPSNSFRWRVFESDPGFSFGQTILDVPVSFDNAGLAVYQTPVDVTLTAGQYYILSLQSFAPNVPDLRPRMPTLWITDQGFPLTTCDGSLQAVQVRASGLPNAGVPTFFVETSETGLCGCPITRDVTLEEDLECPGGDAIIIGADGITIDGAGHTIRGGGSGVGIQAGSHTGVTIKNVVVEGFSTGVRFDGTTSSRIEDSTFTDNSIGVELLGGANSNFIERNRAVGSHFAGFKLLASTGNQLNSNTAIGLGLATGNTSYGFLAENAPGGLVNRFQRNVAADNEYGFFALSSRTLLASNTATNNAMAGFSVGGGSTSSSVYSNLAEGNGNGFAVSSSDYVYLSTNTARSNQSAGFEISGSQGTNLWYCVSTFNFYGVLVNSSQNGTYSRNTIEDNTFGLFLQGASGNRIYDNSLSNTTNASDDGTGNVWNLPKSSGTNVIGGPSRGGNYWAAPDGTGFSETCTDGDGDGFCDSPFAFGGNIDELPLTLSGPIITTVAGGGPPDGLPATSVGLQPSGCAVDASGNVYIVESSQNRVFKREAATGLLSAVAGIGGRAFSGDGGLAVKAGLYYPRGAAVDSSGNLYIADTGNRRIRRVEVASGVITTIAGGSYGTSGDGGPALYASFLYPIAVAVDGDGTLYVSDYSAQRIRRIDVATGVIHTIAGNGTRTGSIDGEGGDPIDDLGDGGLATVASLHYPQGLAVDEAGTVYIADYLNHRIRRIDPVSGVISTIAGNGTAGFAGDGGPATAAALRYPQAVAVDQDANVYVCDYLNRRIRRVDAATGVITTVAGNGSYFFSGDGGPATSAALYYPADVSVDSAGNIYVCDTNNNRLRRVDGATQTIITIAGNGAPSHLTEGDLATSISLYYPRIVAVDSAGDLYLADGVNYRVWKVDGASGLVSVAAGTGNPGFSGDGGLAIAANVYPVSVTVDGLDNLLIATSDRRVRRVEASTGVINTIAGTGVYPGSIDGEGGDPADDLGDGGPATGATFFYAYDLAVSDSGDIYLSDYFGHRVRRVDSATGTISTVAGNGTRTGSIDGEGGDPADDFGDGGPATSASLYYPRAVALDSVGNVYIVDAYSRVRKVDAASETITTVQNIGGLYDLALDGADRLYMTNGSRIRRWDAVTLVFETVAGNGQFGFSGDGGPALAARLSAPQGLVLGSDGALYIADTYNARIRRVDLPPVPTALPDGVVAVRADASGAGDGSSWADAFTDLQAALAAADAASGAVTEIWVAQGSYAPAGPGGDRAATFQLISGVAIYGGFSGAENSLAQRDPAGNPTVLSGDLNGDDGPGFVGNSENSFHVVTASGVDVTAILDGFTIAGGNADTPNDDIFGGGILNAAGSPTLRNLRLVSNWAFGGAAIFNDQGSSPRFVSCLFEGNVSSGSGGAIRNESGTNLALEDSQFIANVAGSNGGAVLSTGSNLGFSNCRFDANVAQSGVGGAIDNLSGTVASFTTCSFHGNSAGSLAGAVGNNFSTVDFLNCLFSGNAAGTNGGAMSNFNGSNSEITSCTFSQNSAVTAGGGLYNANNSSPSLLNSVLWGNADAGGMDESAQIHTDGGNPVVDYSLVQGGWSGAGGTGNLDADPLFVDPDGVDDLPGTHDDDLRLQAGSPAIDAGLDSALPPDLELDVRGNPRVEGTVDMGAHEFAVDCNDNGVADSLEDDADEDGIIDDCDADDDGDSLEDEVDLQPFTASAAFLNDFTFGQIVGTPPSEEELVVRDAADPADGVEILVSGGRPQIEACAFDGTATLTPGSYILTCGSLILDVAEGNATVVTAVDGIEQVVIVGDASVAVVEASVDEETGELSGIVVAALVGDVSVNDEPVPEGETVVITVDSDEDGVPDSGDACPDVPDALVAALSYSGDLHVATGEGGHAAATLSGILTDETDPLAPVPLAGVPVTMTLTDSAGSVLSCGGTDPLVTDASGSVMCVVEDLTPDVYAVALSVVGAGCPDSSTAAFLVVFDPNVPRATGGGFILPDAESTLPAETQKDKANFGFIVRLDNNQAAAGNLEFQYKAADLNLKSQTMTWYTVSNVSAIFEGTATINGAGLYTFRVKATDGDLTGGQPDAFDIRIWTGTDTEADPLHRAKNDLAGGNVVIH